MRCVRDSAASSVLETGSKTGHFAMPIARVTAQHVADFRDARGATVEPAPVLRELTLLSSVFQTARREWGLGGCQPVSGYPQAVCT